MSPAPGTRIGPYEITGPLGAGGMGEVYRARDPRLGRDVAIKALPEALAHDAERIARFEREARLLASLNHPNIGAIHGLEEADGRRYLVLEFVEGETLAQRLRRGALPVREALPVCRAIAAALEAAHESGVIHRDLKPGNVMVRPDGEVKVLDFGLAKGAAAGANASGDAGLSASPTLTYAATGAGIVLGTAAYMSPEQARGKPVDRRTDIWSFGCVLYECLSGRQAFEGETVSDVIARILEREPDWKALPPATPPAIRELLERCLDKDAKQRLRDIGDARLAIGRERGAGSGAGAAVAGAGPAPRRRGVAVAALAGLVAGAALWAAAGAWIAPRPPAPAATHVSIPFPENPRIGDFDLTPDGRTMVLYGAPLPAAEGDDSRNRLYVRRLDDFGLRELAGTEGVAEAGITPDGRSAVFVAPLGPGTNELRLAQVPLDGSVPPVTLTRWDPAWSGFRMLSNGEFVMLDREGRRLFRMGAAGGPVREVALNRGDVRATFRLGDVLPGDRGVFLTAGVYRERGWVQEVGVLDLRNHRITLLDLPGGEATCLPDGTLLFSRGQVLLAAAFDPARLALRGPATPVATGLRAAFSYTPGRFQVGPDGTLYFPPGGEVGNQRRLGVVDRQGRLEVLAAEPHPYQGWPSVSLDGRTFSVRVTNAQGIDEIWVGERGAAPLRRLVSWPQADCVNANLSPDGRTVAYTRIGRDSLDGVYLVEVAEGGNGRRIIARGSGEVSVRPEGWAPDGSRLMVTRERDEASADLWIATLGPARDSALSFRPLVEGPGRKEASSFSPDGRWVSYESDESGRDEIYLLPLRDGTPAGRPFRVTRDGGEVPEWLADGRSLVIRNYATRRARVLDLGDPPSPGQHPVRDWFDFGHLRVQDGWTLRDGSMMVILRGPAESDGLGSVNLVVGWARDLKARMRKAR